MPDAEPPPHRTPDAERPFAREDVFQRVGRMAELQRNSRVLEVGATHPSFAMSLAVQLGCEAVALLASSHEEKGFLQAVKAAGLAGRVSTRKGELPEAGFKNGEFNAVMLPARRHGTLESIVEGTRPLLAKRGRLGLCYPVKVGIKDSGPQLLHWEKALGEKLLLPRDVLGKLMALGFEPEWVETLSDLELDQLYAPWAGQSLDPARQAELELHKAHSGRSGVSFAWVVARRREAGEKPPKSRDRG